MSFDNRQFNVNGEGKGMLGRTIALAMEQEGSKLARAWCSDPEHGLIVKWSGEMFPEPGMNAEQTTEFVWNWLKSDGARKVKSKNQWDSFTVDIDGDIDDGWRVSVGDWGHCAGCSYTIFSVVPAAIWRGR